MDMRVGSEADQETDLATPKADRGKGANPTEPLHKWSVKVPIEIRNAATAAAERDGLTIGQWLTWAIPEMIRQNRQQSRLPAVVEQVDQPVRLPVPTSDLSEIERLTTLSREMHEAAQTPVPASLPEIVDVLLRQRLKAMRLPGPTRQPRASDPGADNRKTPGRTKTGAGSDLDLETV